MRATLRLGQAGLIRFSIAIIPKRQDLVILLKTGPPCLAVKESEMGRLLNLLMTRNSYFLTAVLGAAFVGDIAADYAVEYAWRWNNQGVRLLATLFVYNLSRRSCGRMLSVA